MLKQKSSSNSNTYSLDSITKRDLTQNPGDIKIKYISLLVAVVFYRKVTLYY